MATPDEVTPLKATAASKLEQVDGKLREILYETVNKVLAQADTSGEQKAQVKAWLEDKVAKLEALCASLKCLGGALVLVLIFFLALFLAIPTIVTGAIYGAVGSAPCAGAPLSLWLLVYACASGGFVALGVLLLYCKLDTVCGGSCGETGARVGGKMVAYLGALTGLFLFAWFIVGLLWLTSTASDAPLDGTVITTPTELSSRCDSGLYGATRGFLLFYALFPFCCFAG